MHQERSTKSFRNHKSFLKTHSVIPSKAVLSSLRQRHFSVGGRLRRLRTGIKHYKGVESKCSDSIRVEVARTHQRSFSETVATKYENNDVYSYQYETNSLAWKFQGMPSSLITALGISFLLINRIYLLEI